MDVDGRRTDLLGVQMQVKRGTSTEATSEADDDAEYDDDAEEHDDMEGEDDWTALNEQEALVREEALMRVRANFNDDIDMFDTTMVAEYADDIFSYMEDLETSVLPNPSYMDFQSEIEW